MTRIGSKDYALLIATGFIFGVLAALLWPALDVWYASLATSTLLLCLRHPMWSKVVVLGWCVGQGWVWLYTQLFAVLEVPPACVKNPMVIEARVSDFVRRYPGFAGSTVQAAELELISISGANCRVLQGVRVYYTGARVLSLGDVIVGQVSLRSERGFANFGVDQRKAQAIALQRLASGRLHEIYSQKQAMRGLSYRRRSLSQTIHTHAHLSPAAAGVIAALVVADKRHIPDALKQASLRLGIGHVLVISGLHIALLAGFVGLVMRAVTRPLCWFVPWWVRRLCTQWAVLLLAFGYAQLAGWGLPTQRAVLALLFWLVASGFGRDGQPVRLFWWVLVWCLAVNPFAALLPAFWLSFGAVCVVLIASLVLNRWSGLKAYFAIHITICIAMWPVSLVFFGQASVLSIPANLIAVPVASVWLVPLSLLGASASLAGLNPLANQLWALAAWPIDALDAGLSAYSLAYGVWKTSLPSFVAAALTAMCLVWVTPLRLSYRLGVSLLAWSLIAYRPHPLGQDQARLWVFDVGQGSSMLLQVGARTLMFDLAGGVPGTVYHFDSTAAPIVKALNLARLDTLVLSHDDFDHVGGFYSPNFDLRWHRLITPSGAGELAQPCRPGRVERWEEGVTLRWLSGYQDVNGMSDNASSCVLKVDAFGYSILFMADLGKDQERDLVAYWRDELAADILIVGHHGSDTSSSATLLKWVKPRYAVISAGFNNPFGHPSAAVLKRLERADAQILNTAHTGALRFDWGRFEPLEWRATRAEWARFWQDNYSP